MTVISDGVRQAGGSLVWTAPALLNGWVIFDTGNVWEDPAYVKDNQGFVHLRGIIKDGVFASNTALFGLPVGYRPAARELFPIAWSGSTSVRLDVQPDGTVSIRDVTNNGWLSLSRVSFLAV